MLRPIRCSSFQAGMMSEIGSTVLARCPLCSHWL